jgi:multidrug resistance efflux pump
MMLRRLLCPISALILAACSRTPVPEVAVHADSSKAPANLPEERHIRSTGAIQAVRFNTILVPQLRGPGGQLTLVKLVPNGTLVQQKDIIAQFDSVQQQDDARDARAKMEDLNHQIEQNKAQNRADNAQRAIDIKSAEGDLQKAEIELQKGEVLSEIDRLKNQAKAEDARARLDSLKKSGHFHDVADAAGLKVLELQRDRQQIALDRALGNIEKCSVRAPITGMVALENAWRNGSMGPFEEGDQAWPGQPLVRLFDPTEMIVITQVSEPDGAILAQHGARARVLLDAYPGAVFEAHLESASPVASGGLQSPIRAFSARFRIEGRDSRLMPDLSAAVEIIPGGKPGTKQ